MGDGSGNLSFGGSESSSTGRVVESLFCSVPRGPDKAGNGAYVKILEILIFQMAQAT